MKLTAQKEKNLRRNGMENEKEKEFKKFKEIQYI